jgi:autotransporter-associated beta strand protein
LNIEPLEQRQLLSVNVSTARYDNARDAANTSESILTTSNVNTTTFGKIANMTVDGQIYTQPLIMTNVSIPSVGTRNVVYVATELDTVYAFDAQGNNPAQGYLWKTSLLNLQSGTTGETAVAEADYGTTDIIPYLGITGTPVIDQNTNTLYVVGLFKETNSTYQQRLYALDITNGSVKLGGPVVISASVNSGALTFDPKLENQRPALTLANGEVYIGWASHGDISPWHGWVIAYKATTLHQDYVYCTTPNGNAGGIWMSGGGFAVDNSGNLYFTTGNGDFNVSTNGVNASSNFGMTLEKVSANLTPLDYFAPYNEASLSSGDLDFGCSNVILLYNQSGSTPSEVLSQGKWGTIYLNNQNSLGGITAAAPNNDLGEANPATNLNTSNIHNTIAYWNGYVYSGADAYPIKAYAVGNSTLGTSPTSQSAKVFGASNIEDGQGAGLSVSSNGTSNGILWALDNSKYSTDGLTASPAVLYAYDATNLGNLLWTSSQAANSRDTASNAIKFQTPVVANGYVYVAGDKSVTIYGLFSMQPTLTTPAAANSSVVIGTTTTLSAAGTDPGSDPSPTYTWVATSAPSGATLPTFSVNGTAASNNTTATFYMAGNYTFTCAIRDPATGAAVSTSVNVTVNSTLTSGLTSIVPSSATVVYGGSLQFIGGGTDQFGNTMSAPATWSVVPGGAGGTVDSNGFYTAPASGTTDTVKAVNGTQSATVAITLLAPATTPVATQVSLSSYFNRSGIYTDGSTFSSTGGLDNVGYALSGNLLGTSKVYNGNTFTIGTASTTSTVVNNVVVGASQTITLPAGQYGQLVFLADHTNGTTTTPLQFSVNYADGSATQKLQNFGDWTQGSSGVSGQSIALTMSYRNTNGGTKNTKNVYLYAYSFTLDPTKTIQSLTLPSDSNLELLAIDLVPGIPAPGVAIKTPAAANPSAAGTSTALSVSALDMPGDSAPTYSWAAALMPAGATAPTFSVNNSMSANATTATITQAGTYGFTVTVTDPTTGATVLSSAKVVANFGIFTNSIDIGSPSPAGSLNYNTGSGVYTTTAGGTDIGGTSDQFRYTYESFTGNGLVTAHVSSLTNSNALAKAGPMFRDGTSANGAFAAMFVTPTSGVVFEWRSTAGGSASTVAAVAAPVWLRLNESNGQFSGYYSTNGTTWVQVGTTQNVTLGGSGLAGLAVTSHASGTSTTAAIDSVSAIAAPTVATPAAATPSPATGATTALSVLGADATGEANLTYTWATTGSPPAPVGFSPNGTNAAKNTTATFTKAGNYSFVVTIVNAGGQSVTSTVNVTVNQTYSSMSISPTSPNLTGGSTRQFTATALDQFGQPLVSQPSIAWTLNSGPGTITSGGLYTPPYAGGSAVVKAASGAYNATANVTFTSQAQWNAAADSSWNTSNWIDTFTAGALAAPGVRGLTGDTVLFVTTPLARLDGATPTLAGVTFNNAASDYGITQGSGGSLTLQGGTASDGAIVSVLAGNPAINAPVHLTSNTTFSTATITTLTMFGPINGAGSLTLNGTGKLYLNGANTFTGGLFIQSGTVVVNAANGLADGSSLTVGSNGAFTSPIVPATAPIVSSPQNATPAIVTAQGPSPCAVAAVMAGPPIQPVASASRRVAAIFPNIPFSNTLPSSKDFWWRR